jgi:predicted permease
MSPRKLFRLAPTRASVQHEIDDEMRFHLDARCEELVRLGHSPDDARRIALEEFGDVAAARAELAAIDRRRVGKVALREWIESIAQDLRFAVRSLRAKPGFTATVLLTLALGIGTNAAIFSIVDSMLLRPLPYAEPGRLVHMWETYQSNAANRSEASYPDYLDWKARAHSFAAIGGYTGGSFLLGGDQPASIGGARSTANFFDVLGVRPVLGRSFAEGEDAVGAPRVVLLSYGLWQRQFSGDRGVVGRSIVLNGAPATIVGVLPQDFRFARQPNADVWVPVDRAKAQREQRGNHWLNTVARLAPGVTTESAAREMAGIMNDLAQQYPPSNKERSALVIPLQDELVGPVRPVLLLLYGAVVVVLLIACVNVANLLLIRAADRQREIAVRVALGAGKGRIVRQLLTESVLLALVGGTLGVALALAEMKAVLSLMPAQPIRGIPPITTHGLDARILAYAFLVAVAVGLAFGIAPIPSLLKSKLHDALKSGARGSSGGAGRVRDALVVGEIALTVILLSGALLFGRSVMRLMSIDPGFRSDHLVTAGVVLPASRATTPVFRADVYRRLEERIRQIPGVQNVGAVSKLPLDFGNTISFAIAGQPTPEAAHFPEASYREANAAYFATMGIPLVAGRAFNAGDDLTAPGVAIVNRSLAKAYFGGRDPVGQRLTFGNDTLAIVGVVGDVPIGKLEESVPPTLYIALSQDPLSSLAIAVRTTADAKQLAPALREALRGADPEAALTLPRTMDDLIMTSPSVFLRRLPLYIIGAFALTALLLAIVGIYGVVSYAVAQRTREMGIRMALGAQPAALVRLVVRHGLWMAAFGVVLGAGGARLAGRYAEKMLYGVQAGDPVTYVGVSMLLAAVAVAASVLPARRAARVDPALALRAD